MFGLPDYRRDISIVVDFFANEDQDGIKFKQICREVQMRLEKYVIGDADFRELFESIPVVGFFFDKVDFSIDERSNRAVFRYWIAESY